LIFHAGNIIGGFQFFQPSSRQAMDGGKYFLGISVLM
jgi:hypothetical protein